MNFYTSIKRFFGAPTTTKTVVSEQTLLQLIQRLWHHINLRRRWQLSLLLVLMMLTSFAEIVSIGAVVPFIAVLTSPDQVFDHPSAQLVIQAFKWTEPSQLLLPLTIVFAVAVLIAGGMRLLLLWGNTRLSFATGADFSINIYRRTLYQPYSVHCARNSSEVISGISNKTNGVIYSVICQLLTLISSCFMLLTILFALIAVEPLISLVTFGGFGLIYILIILLTKKQLMLDGKRISRETTNVIKSLQEGLGGIRDVLIDGTQSTYCQNFSKADLKLRRAQGNNLFISSSPRFLMEALGMLFISLLAYSLANKPNGINEAIPILGALAYGAQRLLPMLQQAYSAWSNILGAQAILIDIIDLLNQKLPKNIDQLKMNKFPFKKNILLKQLGFRYRPHSPHVLKNFNLTIAKGSRVGFVGTTGSGKSTLFDIIMGLLHPTEGILEVDGKQITSVNNYAWQANIAHVPQTIFLVDSSIEDNIAFGIPKDQIDIDRVQQAAKQAQIASTIESWPKKYQTLVGERGISLSGGQRQRIGIARALYKQANIIFFDEATSALDNETEDNVMQAIGSLSQDLTLLIIAHRVTTLKNCTQIVEISDGTIKRVGSYKDIVRS